MDTRLIVQIAIGLAVLFSRFNFYLPFLAIDPDLHGNLLSRAVILIPLAVTLYAIYYAFLRKGEPTLLVGLLLAVAVVASLPAIVLVEMQM